MKKELSCIIMQTITHKVNGLEESINKNLIRILKKTMIENQRSWHLALPNALWADRVTPKNSLGVSLYTLDYGK